MPLGPRLESPLQCRVTPRTGLRPGQLRRGTWPLPRVGVRPGGTGLRAAVSRSRAGHFRGHRPPRHLRSTRAVGSGDSDERPRRRDELARLLEQPDGSSAEYDLSPGLRATRAGTSTNPGDRPGRGLPPPPVTVGRRPETASMHRGEDRRRMVIMGSSRASRRSS